MAQLTARVRAHLGTKWLMFIGLAVGIPLPYFTLQQAQLFPPREPWVTPIDALVPFAPAWTLVYLSVCLLVPLFPLLAETREQVWRYGRAVAWLCLPCFACFLLAPVPGPRPAGVAGAAPDGSYGWLIGVDATWNAFPSLHAGLVVLSFLYGWRLLGPALGPRGRVALAVVSAVWGGAILYSTLATKQHWLADLLPACLLAVAADRLAWRGVRRSGGAHGAPASAPATR